jgi:hypothetical protein
VWLLLPSGFPDLTIRSPVLEGLALSLAEVLA